MFTGDARGDELLSQLEAGSWLDADTRRHFDVLSVPHHGAARSNVSTFLSRVTAQMYVISAGDKHDHPGMETLTQILDGQASQKSERIIFATNETASISAFRRQSLPAQRDALKILAPDSHAFTISLALMLYTSFWAILFWFGAAVALVIVHRSSANRPRLLRDAAIAFGVALALFVPVVSRLISFTPNFTIHSG